MIRHIVLFWLKDTSEDNVARTVAVLNSMKGKIPGMLSIDAGADVVKSPRSCDICLCETFDTLASLEAYRTHPVHLPVQAHMHAVMERSHSADYEVPTA